MSNMINGLGPIVLKRLRFDFSFAAGIELTPNWMQVRLMLWKVKMSRGKVQLPCDSCKCWFWVKRHLLTFEFNFPAFYLTLHLGLESESVKINKIQGTKYNCQLKIVSEEALVDIWLQLSHFLLHFTFGIELKASWIQLRLVVKSDKVPTEKVKVWKVTNVTVKVQCNWESKSEM